jgi:hypothetical protein
VISVGSLLLGAPSVGSPAPWFGVGAHPDDLALVVRVRSRLLATPGLSGPGRQLRLEARRGVVTLRGPPLRPARRLKVLRAVRAVPGVLAVEDRAGSPESVSDLTTHRE